MILVCAWCNKHMGEKYSDFHPADTITHGICEDCMNNLFKKKQIDFTPFLNTISAPVVLLDENNQFLAANKLGLEKLGKKQDNLDNSRTGDVFTCENANLPGGCGYTEKCKDCQLLALINHTYKTKQSFAHIPVSIIKKTDNISQKLDLELTTENLNGMILMRIDSMKP